MNSNTATLIIAIVALALAGYAAWRANKIPTMTELTATVEDSLPTGQDFAQVAEIAVNAVEQLRREDKIKTNDEAFSQALAISHKYLPTLTVLENEKMVAAIHAAVLVASALTAQIEAAKAEVLKKTVIVPSTPTKPTHLPKS